jgi:hypothetical protein
VWYTVGLGHVKCRLGLNAEGKNLTNATEDMKPACVTFIKVVRCQESNLMTWSFKQVACLVSLSAVTSLTYMANVGALRMQGEPSTTIWFLDCYNQWVCLSLEGLLYNFKRICQEGIKIIMLHLLLLSCSHVDLVFQALHYFDSMGSSLQDSCNSGTPHSPTLLTFLEMLPFCRGCDQDHPQKVKIDVWVDEWCWYKDKICPAQCG